MAPSSHRVCCIDDDARERRRQNRERQALEMNTQQDHSEANLAQLAPVLDEAIDQLGTEERSLLLKSIKQRWLSLLLWQYLEAGFGTALLYAYLLDL